MNATMMESDDDDREMCKFIEVLTAQQTGATIGYRFGGDRPGPNALVAGDARLMQSLFNRLHNLPTLPWMWGKLYLVTLDEMECTGLQDISRCIPDIAFDALVMLPYAPGADTHDFSIDRAYWTSLRLCRQLGMIQGRGVNDDRVFS
ncbi:MAG: hypothetical protein WA790_00135 [Sulfitobacter sp.]